MLEQELWLADECATVNMGLRLGRAVKAVKGVVTLYLEGHLGAGKTTLTRGLLQSFNHTGRVKSPTYTLVEAYEMPIRTLYHFDLYRLGDPEELEYMGIRDYFTNNSVCIIEWPNRGEGILPAADVILTLTVQDGGRLVKLSPHTKRGLEILSRIKM